MDSSTNPDQPTTEEQPPVPAPETTAPNPAPTVTTEVVTPGPSDNQPVPDKPKHKYTLDIVVGLLLLALAGGAFYAVNIYLKPKDATKASTKKDIAVLRVSLENPLPTALYPLTQADGTEALLNLQVFEGLTAFEQQTKIVPSLAESWTNPDPNTWIFKLKTGVKFHDGNTMTSKQVKASLDQSQNYFMGKNLATTIKSVEAVDARTVKITTDGPDPLLANKLTELFIWDTDANKTGDTSTGTGPYNLDSKSATEIKLSAFDGYHGGHVYTRSVQILEADNSTASKALIASKSVDVASTEPLTDTEAGGLKHQVVVNNGTYHYVFNTLRKGSPLAKLAVRQALAQATDKAAITKVSGSNTPLATQTVPVGIPGYNPTLQGLPYDVAAAKAAIVAAGYPKGFSITLTYFPSGQATAAELKRQFALVGVTLVLDPESDQRTLIQKAIGGGTDMYANSTSSSLIDASDIFSDFIDTPNYKNATLDALNTAAASTIDPAKRVAILQQMSKVLLDDQGDIPVHAAPNADLYVAPAIHITQDQQADNQVGAYFWKVYSD